TAVTILADNSAATTTLTAGASGFDPEGNPVTFAFQWLQNGTPLSGQTGHNLNLAALSGVHVGDSFAVRVTPGDGTFTGPAFTSKPLTVSTTGPLTLTAPAVTAVSIAPDSA